MKRFLFLLTVLVLLVASVLPVAAEAPVPIEDRYSLLSEAELNTLVEEVQAASEQLGCPVHVIVYKADRRADWYLGEDFIYDNGLSFRKNRVVLTVNQERGDYYYDLYLYGRSARMITDDEANALYDDRAINAAFKGDQLAGGISLLLQETVAYHTNDTRVISPFLLALPIALILALAFSAIICGGIAAGYRRKKPSVDYPLSQFAKLELTEQEDSFAGSFVTTRIVDTSPRGGAGRSGGSFGGSGSRGGFGGGRGHAGGR